MTVALRQTIMNFPTQTPVPVWFREKKVGEFRADIIVESSVVLELKSAGTLESAHEAQLLHYWKSTEIEVGLLPNFGERPRVRRLLFDNVRKKIREIPRESVAEALP